MNLQQIKEKARRYLAPYVMSATLLPNEENMTDYRSAVDTLIDQVWDAAQGQGTLDQLAR